MSATQHELEKSFNINKISSMDISQKKFLKNINTVNDILARTNDEKKTNIISYKRIFDIVFSLSVLLLASPAFILIGLMIKIFSPGGKVFFFQNRLGLNGRIFKCYKFRTMIPDFENVLQKLLKEKPELRKEFEKDFKLKNDPRIIPVIGIFLRKTSLDELPQFLNVLIGNMSVVGPRPIVSAEKEKYGKAISKFLSKKPGITGLWQVSGRNNISYEKRVCLDIEYIDKNNFFMDLQIIFKTIVVMLVKDGAY